MLKLRSCLSLVLCLVFFFSMPTLTYAQSSVLVDKSDFFVDEETAKKAAIFLIIDTCHSDPDSPWNDGIILNKSEYMYDFANQLTAYLFYISNLNNEPTGYIVINSSKLGIPVIEFSQSKDSYFYEIQKLNEVTRSNSNKLYYLGGLNYYLESGNDEENVTVYDLNSADLRQISETTMNEIQISYDTEKEMAAEKIALSLNSQVLSKEVPDEESTLSYFSLWNTVETTVMPMRSSSPPTGNVEITDPSLYESGYETYNTGNVDTAAYLNKNFHTTSALRYVNGVSYPGNCGPVAATNIMQYYKYRYDNKGWECKIWIDSPESTFVELCSYLPYPAIHDKGGTDTTTLSEGLRSYALSRGDKWDSNYYNNCNFDIIKQQIQSGRPMIYNVFNHGYYDDHSMVAFAFREYVYSGLLGTKTYSRYLAVADGKVSTANRYVHYDKSKCSVNTFFATTY